MKRREDVRQIACGDAESVVLDGYDGKRAVGLFLSRQAHPDCAAIGAVLESVGQKIGQDPLQTTRVEQAWQTGSAGSNRMSQGSQDSACAMTTPCASATRSVGTGWSTSG